jgi:hydroxypyruvate reductase/glycerate 2-kinase
MPDRADELRRHARSIWDAAVVAVDPFALVRAALTEAGPLRDAVRGARRVIVLGGGKAGAAMAAAVEDALADRLSSVVGVVNVPAEAVRPLRSIRLHAARPAGTNQPTAEGVAGAEAILRLAAGAGPDDVGLCLLSGGGSALLPAPAEGVSLADKQGVTQMLHSCGATIDEMNCVRKHLSRIKGGRLAQAFRGRALYSLILSDVIGDPLDVIASGPTAADPTTFADALAVLAKYGLTVPLAVREHLERGRASKPEAQARDNHSLACASGLDSTAGQVAETLKQLPDHVHNLVLGNSARALAAAERCAAALGYRVVDLGSYLEGDTAALAVVLAGIVRAVRRDGRPAEPPLCLLSGGETTVKLGEGHGKGGRNQEFVLALLQRLGVEGMRGVVILSGGTDGEDGPTDAAGALADAGTLVRAAAANLDAAALLARHDAYAYFAATGDLLRTGLTGTNVMDVRVILIDGAGSGAG